ncbi:YbaY family lipoprotein [Chitinibacter bivalviorum]|uniref:YbaY family lipoprotein n=1 Tax=Chitinibacter bivalviorum TaxID=2739434 RepID=A0A7H9BL50_9NEIS|nr:YbaY family lipoprotein [Chitinibacter bivalviorum]QLG89303.1 YbaY family lipoprotein [Chitinibacter bivalviorum]
MKKILFLIALSYASLAQAQSSFSQTFRCSNGTIFQVSSQGEDSIVVNRGLYQKATEPSRITLKQVISASGARYSDGNYTVWLKGDNATILKDETVLQSDCAATRADEPLSPVRDAASGVVFIPPDRWLSKDVRLTAVAGSDIQGDAKLAAHQLSYTLHDAQHTKLLDILVFPSSDWPKVTAPAQSLMLGNDGQRIYIALLPSKNPFEPSSEAGQQFAQLQISAAEVKQAFSMYGTVVNQAIETVRVKVSWMEKSLRPGSEQIIELRDMSADKPGEIIAKHSQVLEKGSPKPVTLRFDPAAINPKHQYQVSAKLMQEGRLVLESSAVDVLTLSHGRDAQLWLTQKKAVSTPKP